ncbi:ABC transporter permease subunit [Nocardioides sp.]|uniref:ABC transporter permease n=1 Tax=Nocardioides sp. TaxID=35761 RepID=UPI002601ECEC|nr:ABC transporter permease subunit [Nocardioides sp.]
MTIPSVAAVRRALGRAALTVLPAAAVLGAVIGLWYYVSLGVLTERKRFLLPPPHEVFTDGFFDPKVRADILSAFWMTTKEAMIGLLVAVVIATVLALLMAQAKWVERSLYPWLIVIQTIPTLAMIPMIGFWFGYSLTPRVLICVIIALFPLVINPLQGMLGVDRGLHDLLSLAGANRVTRLLTLQLPAAMPDFFVGLRQAAGLSVVGATVGDYFFGKGDIGLGLLISKYTARVEAAPMLAVAFAACFLGIVVFMIFGALGRRVMGRWSPAWGAY